jgi:hypothetical protein
LINGNLRACRARREKLNKNSELQKWRRPQNMSICVTKVTLTWRAVAFMTTGSIDQAAISFSAKASSRLG